MSVRFQVQKMEREASAAEKDSKQKAKKEPKRYPVHPIQTPYSDACAQLTA